MPLIVIKRKEKGLANDCLRCEHFGELKDDIKQYPSTVAIVCNAPQTVWVNCFDYMWLMVRGRVSGRAKRKEVVPKAVAIRKVDEVRDILKRLRAIRKT